MSVALKGPYDMACMANFVVSYANGPWNTIALGTAEMVINKIHLTLLMLSSYQYTIFKQTRSSKLSFFVCLRRKHTGEWEHEPLNTVYLRGAWIPVVHFVRNDNLCWGGSTIMELKGTPSQGVIFAWKLRKCESMSNCRLRMVVLSVFIGHK